MNAIEIEAEVDKLAQAPFDSIEFPFQFLRAFDVGDSIIKRLRKGELNKSDVPGAVLQPRGIHLGVAPPGETGALLRRLRESPRAATTKAKYALATDGETIEAEDLRDGGVLSCPYAELDHHFGFFLPLAGITTVKEIKENPIDIRATARLNKLYVELLDANPQWQERRHDMNHFMARLIFCFFAEDTDIFHGRDKFTLTIDQRTSPDGSNVHTVLETIFRAMNVPSEERTAANLAAYADQFPYVNGGLFSDSPEVPRFTKIARSYLRRAGELNWQEINPDIFGSMIQAIADDEERGELGMHYTSVPNILKVLNPLFLDDLLAALDAAGENARSLALLRRRLAHIRVFDPACGSGNFLVIAYRELRAIEAEINRRRGEPGRKSDIPLTNFRGIEIRHFAAEIARLALVIAQFQCDVRHRGPQLALTEFLPLAEENWIRFGNALHLSWSEVCPREGAGVRVTSEHLFAPDRLEMDFENEGGEVFVCGNPPYLGKGKKEDQHLRDMEAIFGNRTDKFGYIDYVGCWFLLAGDYCRQMNARVAFVSTNSISQGRQLPQLWPHVLRNDTEIIFAHNSFKWSNSAAHNAGVTCVIVGMAQRSSNSRKVLYSSDSARNVPNINAYLLNGPNLYVESQPSPLSRELRSMTTGSVPNDGGNLILAPAEVARLTSEHPDVHRLVHRFYGSEDYIQGQMRSCLVIRDEDVSLARSIGSIADRLDRVEMLRLKSKKKETREQLAQVPHRFQHRGAIPTRQAFIVPSVSSERREYFPVGLLGAGAVVSNLAFMVVDAPLWNLALIASRLHLVWIATVCGKLKTDYRYSNTLGWNTFPVPKLTERNKAELTECAEGILLAREAHFPKTIAQLYDPETMPDDLRAAHERNDQTLERIYIGRRFRNDTERLEKLFAMYEAMIAAEAKDSTPKSKRPKKAGASEESLTGQGALA